MGALSMKWRMPLTERQQLALLSRETRDPVLKTASKTNRDSASMPAKAKMSAEQRAHVPVVIPSGKSVVSGNAERNTRTPSSSTRRTVRSSVPVRVPVARHALPVLSEMLVTSESPPAFDEWPSARQRAWNRRVRDPNIYLMQYPIYAEETCDCSSLRWRWSIKEHVLFLAALHDYYPFGHSWGIFSAMVPGRNGAECRSYFRLLVRTGKVDPASGEVRTQILNKHNDSSNPVLLCANIRKFVPHILPTLASARRELNCSLMPLRDRRALKTKPLRSIDSLFPIQNGLPSYSPFVSSIGSSDVVHATSSCTSGKTNHGMECTVLTSVSDTPSSDDDIFCMADILTVRQTTDSMDESPSRQTKSKVFTKAPSVQLEASRFEMGLVAEGVRAQALMAPSKSKVHVHHQEPTHMGSHTDGQGASIATQSNHRELSQYLKQHESSCLNSKRVSAPPLDAVLSLLSEEYCIEKELVGLTGESVLRHNTYSDPKQSVDIFKHLDIVPLQQNKAVDTPPCAAQVKDGVFDTVPIMNENVICNETVVSSRKPPLGTCGFRFAGLQKRELPISFPESNLTGNKRAKKVSEGATTAEFHASELRKSIAFWTTACSKRSTALGHLVERRRLLNEFDRSWNKINRIRSETIRKLNWSKPSSLFAAAKSIGCSEGVVYDFPSSPQALSSRELWLELVSDFQERMYEIDSRQRQEMLTLDMVSHFLG
jgi:hypothetical protein